MPPEQPAGEPPASNQPALRDQTYRIALGTAIGLLAIATVIYRILEDWSWVDSFYFSSVAASTVGFGDLHPTTDVTKLFTVFYIFAGMSLLGAVLNERLRRHAEQRAESREEARLNTPPLRRSSRTLRVRELRAPSNSESGTPRPSCRPSQR